MKKKNMIRDYYGLLTDMIKKFSQNLMIRPLYALVRYALDFVIEFFFLFFF
jgi:hypothetical protein